MLAAAHARRRSVRRRIRRLIEGNTAVIRRQFDAEEVWRHGREVQRQRDRRHRRRDGAPARRRARARCTATSTSRRSSRSAVTAAIFSQTVKEQLQELLPEHLVMTDAVGSTETGMNGIRFVQKGDEAARTASRRVQAVARHGRARRRLRTDRARLGRGRPLARGGNIPLGYYNDPEKTAADVRHRRRRPALVDPRRLRDASRPTAQVTLLGRGSVVDQLRRREDLSRRGRGRAEVAPRRVRRAGRRRARRALGRARHRGRAGPRRARRRRSRSSTRTAARRSPATRRRSSCSSSTRSAGRRAASPTTRGPRSTRKAAAAGQLTPAQALACARDGHRRVSGRRALRPGRARARRTGSRCSSTSRPRACRSSRCSPRGRDRFAARGAVRHRGPARAGVSARGGRRGRPGSASTCCGGSRSRPGCGSGDDDYRDSRRSTRSASSPAAPELFGEEPTLQFTRVVGSSMARRRGRRDLAVPRQRRGPDRAGRARTRRAAGGGVGARPSALLEVVPSLMAGLFRAARAGRDRPPAHREPRRRRARRCSGSRSGSSTWWASRRTRRMPGLDELAGFVETFEARRERHRRASAAAGW